MKTIKFCWLLFFLFIVSLVHPDYWKFSNRIEEILQQDEQFQLKINDIKQEKANYKIERAMNLLELKAGYQEDRDEIFESGNKDGSIEKSEMIENDRQWKLEIEKTFFQKDYDNLQDIFRARIDLFKFRANLVIERLEMIDRIVSDIIAYSIVDQKIKVLESRLFIKKQENNILRTEYENEISDENNLIENLTEIRNIENELYRSKQKKESISNKYTSLDAAVSEFQKLNIAEVNIDSSAFKKRINDRLRAFQKTKNKMNRSLKFSRLFNVLPELRLRLSYNKRKLNRDWETEIHTEDIEETYPQIDAELSIPLNFVDNIGGKYLLIKSLIRELNYEYRRIEKRYSELNRKLLNDYDQWQKRVEAEYEIFQLQELRYQQIKDKYASQPTLLGLKPEIEKMKADIEFEKAGMKLEEVRLNALKSGYIIKYFTEQLYEK